jgi:undecaprenyl-diphosphatase
MVGDPTIGLGGAFVPGLLGEADVVLAVLLGLVQGVFEWLPISSEGSVALLVTVVSGDSPAVATQFALFLHAGTAMAALVFYRREARSLADSIPDWRPSAAFDGNSAELTFFGVATVVSGVLGIAIYAALAELASSLTGGTFVALIGGLLVLTGVVQRVAEDSALSQRDQPDATDAVLVGVMQGLALLPGVSRSGTTDSALLLRGHDGERAFELSFLLSVPASLGAGLLVVLDTGVPAIGPSAAALALGISAGVGYLTVSALVGLVQRVAFWGVCVGFGSLAVVGGLLLVL